MKLPLYTERMFSLIEYVLKHNINGCETQQHFFDSIEYGSSSNLTNIRNGAQSFRLEQYQNAIIVYNLDANYFFKEDAPMFDMNKNVPAIHRLNEAVAAVSRELYHSKLVNKEVNKKQRKTEVHKKRTYKKVLQTS